MSCILPIRRIQMISFRNAPSVPSWVPPLDVRSRPVWRPTTITAACKTRPSTSRIWLAASTSELYPPLLSPSQLSNECMAMGKCDVSPSGDNRHFCIPPKFSEKSNFATLGIASLEFPMLFATQLPEAEGLKECKQTIPIKVQSWFGVNISHYWDTVLDKGMQIPWDENESIM